MSIDLDIRKRYVDGEPVLFWENRLGPLIIGSQVTAHSGKICIVRTVISSEVGKPMRVRFRLARKSHLSTWEGLIDSSPFNTTSLASYFVTGHTVIFDQNEPIVQQGEVIKDYDLDQDIFSAGGNYRSGFDLFSGTLNLIIVT